jgi:acyl transferase domain-containing protein/NAD(P)H-dependent flavin oxidoreductase YrpB (nitropropane dioxygenase family)/NADP-dependent 3-hydroxy acid dehydrogenase YdfG
MVRDPEYRYVVLTPPGRPDGSLAIAASRAGALGVLSCEFAETISDCEAALGQLDRHHRRDYGVLVDCASEELLSAVLALPVKDLSTLILSTPLSVESLADQVRRIHASGRAAWVVVTSLSGGRDAEAAGADALLAKGHEAGGWVGEETSLVLLQRLLANLRVPVFAYGGIGLHSAAGCYAAGAAGLVLDSQLLLLRESPLAPALKARLATFDGSETITVGTGLGAAFRAYARPNLPAADELRQLETQLTLAEQPAEVNQRDWRRFVRTRVGYQSAEANILAIGQDAAFAASFAKRFGSVGGLLAALHDSIAEHCAVAQQTRPLAEGAPLATSHATRYPIAQGPMTRVSDRAEFAAAVAEGGGLPFLALALMRAPDVRTLLDETRQRLGERPWGVGILGFVPPELRAEQLAVIREVRPPFALIAGGRPDQARQLEADGIPTYLHVPSPGLLEMFLQEGARRFVFEGRECGGHVGPRTSFVLWDSMIDVLLKHAGPTGDGSDYHVLFAGGIHDAMSGAIVSAMAAPLVKRGFRIGVLMGTAYLFTKEAVDAGAIVPAFQQEAVNCEETVLLESGPGHATRCAPSPFCEDFLREKRRLLQDGLPVEEIRSRLEDLNVGRLRIASKGVDRNPRFGQDPAAPKLVPVPEAEQRLQGMYMIGQVAALRRDVGTIAALHEDVSAGSSVRLATTILPLGIDAEPPPPAEVAIVGMACVLPGASDLATFWSNILNKVDSVTEVPASRWDWRQYFDPDKDAKDKAYSRWGGFIGEVPFDPLDFGMPPNSLTSIEPFQLLTLAVVREALRDAGYADRPFQRERTSVILGAGGGAGDLSIGYITRSAMPDLFGESATPVVDRLGKALPEWTEDSFPGILLNVAAGRVSNRFDLGGVNYTVDAACASSLAAVYHAVRELENNTSDVVIVGGIDTLQSPFSFLAFSKTRALSPNGRCRTFDAQADGIAIGEGLAILVLKRLADAERDGDRIYAVIRGVGGSSDGRDRSLTAPRPEGQVRALRRAYQHAGFSPATIGLVEAHGTGTVVGDQAEVEALSAFFGQAGAPQQRCAIGSVKSMIGHTKATAGVAGLTKVALALYHRVLPPTLGVVQPNPKANFPQSPFYINSEARPWIQGESDLPRRAGVSAFGFGGTNFHIVLEEYTGRYLPEVPASVDPWPAELFLWRGATGEQVSAALATLAGKLDAGARPNLGDLAATLASQPGTGSVTLAIVASSLPDLREKLGRAQAVVAGNAVRKHDAQGIHLSREPYAPAGKVAFLFPGQGSQYVGMLRDLAILYPEARETFERADRALADRLPQPLSRFVFPPPAFSPEEEQRQQAALTATEIAQPALGAAGVALARVLAGLGVEPDLVAGHSYGEFVALHAAGAIDEATLFLLSEARGRFIREGAIAEAGTMAAVEAGAARLAALLVGVDVTLANKNAPEQTVISGKRADVDRAIAVCAESGIRARRIPVACAFHSPLVAPAQQRLAALLRQVPIAAPQIPTYSNTTGGAYPTDPAAIVDLLAEHLVRPVEFVEEIQALHTAGARLFVEVGPRTVLTGLVSRILADAPHLAVSLDQAGRSGIAQLLNGLAALASEGVAVQVPKLFQGRRVRTLDLAHLERETGEPRYSPTTWLIDGGRARPARVAAANGRPEPLRIAAVEETRQGATGSAAISERAPAPGPIVTAAPSAARASGGPPPAANGSAANRPGVLTLAVPATVRPAISQAPPQRDAPIPKNVEVKATPVRTLPAQPAPSPVVQTTADLARSAAPASLVSTDRASEAIRQFQQVMQHFLETQRSVMLAYLQTQGGVAGPPLITLSPVASGGSLATGNGSPAAPIEPLAVSAPSASVAPPPVRPNETPPTPRSEPRASSPPTVVHHVDSEPGHGRNGRANGVAAAPGRPAEAAPVPAPAPAPTTGTETVAERLLGVVSERTGYPIEMLGLDADLEADLGIDSIKRVEIVGTVVRALALPTEKQPEMEKLTASRTLRQLIDQLSAAVGTLGSAARNEGDQRPFEPEAAKSAVGRFLVRVVAAPPIERRTGVDRTGAIVVVDDETGVGDRMAESLRREGYTVARVTVGRAAPDAFGSLVHPGNLDEVVALVDRLRASFGGIAGLVHLGALRPGASAQPLDPERWYERLAEDVKCLYLLVRELGPDLRRAASHGGAVVLAATRLGGTFAFDGDPTDFFPGHGGVGGFLKTLSQEEPGLRVKAVDLDSEPTDLAARWLLDELGADDGLTEVGYVSGRRMRLTLVRQDLAPTNPPADLDSSSVVLITGGARGITAEAAFRLASAYRPTLVLVGRTPAPTAPEAADTAGQVDHVALKRALIDRRRAAGLPLAPAAVQEEFQRLLHEREVRDNLARLREAGARVEYVVGDVRDAAGLTRLVEDVYARLGRIDAVIHGSGVIEDKLIRDKVPESFDRVIRTKVDGAVTLARVLRPAELKFLVYFSSISGRFGNRGQADYAAASDILNKLADWLDRRWPGRIVSFNWGPWQSVGMASADVQRQFAERGVGLIPVADGCQILLDELRYGRKGDVEVVVGAFPTGRDLAGQPI